MEIILAVNLLGKFQVISEKGVLNVEVMHSDMLTKLFVYILLYREHAIPIQDLADALWQDDETDNPAGALKNLMYRLRSILKKTFGDEEYILTSRGGYFWNPEIPVVVDTEEFEAYCDKAKQAVHKDVSMQYYEKAVELYQGEFMTQIMDRHWVITLSTFYHSLFLSAAKNLAELYLEAGRYDEMEGICTEAIRCDSLDEQLYYYQILALVKQNKVQLAMEQCEQASKILKEALGVRNPQLLSEVYQKILLMTNGTVAEAIGNICEDMVEDEHPTGAYFCGYPVFREIYRLESRKLGRLGEAEFVVLLTLSIKENMSVNDQMRSFLIGKGMEQMKHIIAETLRIGDVAAEYSDSQYVMLLPACSYESCMLVTNRILSKLYHNNSCNKISVKIELEEVTLNRSELMK